MQRVKNTKIPWVFLSNFEVTEHKYPTRFSKYNFKQLQAFISYPKFSVSSQGPQLWNKISEASEKKRLKPSHL